MSSHSKTLETWFKYNHKMIMCKWLKGKVHILYIFVCISDHRKTGNAVWLGIVKVFLHISICISSNFCILGTFITHTKRKSELINLLKKYRQNSSAPQIYETSHSHPGRFFMLSTLLTLYFAGCSFK